jgi:hypothetical protein
MYKIIAFSISIVICCFCGCVSVHQQYKEKTIHPKVFGMVECWLSDTTYPVATEVNLDAVEKNKNQFDYDNITKKGNWISYPDETTKGFLRYKILSHKDNEYKIIFQKNSGGSLTTENEIKFVILKRQITIGNKKKNIRVLKITSIKNI